MPDPKNFHITHSHNRTQTTHSPPQNDTIVVDIHILISPQLPRATLIWNRTHALHTDDRNAFALWKFATHLPTHSTLIDTHTHQLTIQVAMYSWLLYHTILNVWENLWKNLRETFFIKYPREILDVLLFRLYLYSLMCVWVSLINTDTWNFPWWWWWWWSLSSTLFNFFGNPYFFFVVISLCISTMRYRIEFVSIKKWTLNSQKIYHNKPLQPLSMAKKNVFSRLLRIENRKKIENIVVFMNEIKYLLSIVCRINNSNGFHFFNVWCIFFIILHRV